jgi:subtilisin family serine protease
LLVCLAVKRDSISQFAAPISIDQLRPARTPQLDQVRAWLGVQTWIARGGGDGHGVVIAIVDTGFSLRHPALRQRAYRYFDASVPDAPALESAQVQQWIAQEEQSGSRSPQIAQDPWGHGTLTASIAAGSDPRDRQYEGIAPGASLVLIRAGQDNRIDDNQWRTAVALALHAAGTAPLVLVSTATGIAGTHDGERLEALSSRPSTALVVAAGNNGPARGAFGHQRAHLSRGAPLALRFRAQMPAQSSRTFAMVHEGEVSFHLVFSDGTRTQQYTGASARGATHAGWSIGVQGSVERTTVAHAQQSLALNQSPSTVLITVARGTGAQTPGDQFSLVVSGQGAIDLFAQDASIDFAQGDHEMTLGDLATLQDSIAVTALGTRDRWLTANGEQIRPIATDWDSVARFSSVGPDRVHHARPELAAPGGWVVGALSLEATTSTEGSVLALPEQRTHNPLYVAAAGTSVAAPIVAGAIARVWSTQPALSRDAVVSLLSANSPQWSVTGGWGAIDLTAEFAAPHAMIDECSAVAARAHLLPGQPVDVAVRFRSAGHAVAQAIEPAVSVSEGTVSSIRALEGGRTIVRWRAASQTQSRVARIALEVAASTHQSQSIQCTTYVRIEDEPALPSAPVGCAVCGIFAGTTPQVALHRVIAWLSVVLVAGLFGRRPRRWSATH